MGLMSCAVFAQSQPEARDRKCCMQGISLFPNNETQIYWLTLYVSILLHTHVYSDLENTVHEPCLLSGSFLCAEGKVEQIVGDRGPPK